MAAVRQQADAVGRSGIFSCGPGPDLDGSAAIIGFNCYSITIDCFWSRAADARLIRRCRGRAGVLEIVVLGMLDASCEPL
jgi:hypothetical protein